MTRNAALALLVCLAVAGCGAADEELRLGALGAAPSPTACAAPAAPAAEPAPALLQMPLPDVPGPFFSARTDGPCALVVVFTGAPEGDGPCHVARYAGTLSPAGPDLRLDVTPVHTGEQPDGDTWCPLPGQVRTLRAVSDAPLAGRRVLDSQDRPVLLVDGDRLLLPQGLPDGWSVERDGSAGPPVHWRTALRGPRGAIGLLAQGEPGIGQGEGDALPGERVLSRPQVRGLPAELAVQGGPSPAHLLRWVEAGQGFHLQVLGPLPDPAVLVEIADGLRPGA